MTEAENIAAYERIHECIQVEVNKIRFILSLSLKHFYIGHFSKQLVKNYSV